MKLVPFESMGAVSDTAIIQIVHTSVHSTDTAIVAMVVSVAICYIFSIKEWCTLENRVRVRSRSLEMAPFDRSHTSS